MKTANALAIVLISIAVPAMAQQSSQADARWQAWLGCWQLADARGGAQVCVTPSADQRGATLTTTAGGRSVLEQTIVADGEQHPLTDTDCRGWQRAAWSRSGQRLFTSGELTCGERQERRRVSGFALMGAMNTWIDIQAVEVDGRETVRVRRYQPVSDRSRQRAAVSPFTLDDVKEASAVVSASVLEAALSETKAGFDLTSRRLVELKDARVPASVIDLMVALSYPDRFVVESRRRAEPYSIGSLGGGYGLSAESEFGWASASSYFWPYYYGGYPQYSVMYDYSPLGYGYWGGSSPWYGWGSGYYPLDSDQPTGGGSGGGSQAESAGRAIGGLGYTRVRPRETVPDGAQAQGGVPNRASSTAPDAASSPAASAPGASSQGYSGGGSDGGSGRTAQPR